MKESKLTFTIPVPASTKNSRRLIRRGRGITSLPSKKAVVSMRQIRAAALEAAKDHERAEDGTVFGDQDIGVTIKHRVPDDTATVEVWSLGPRPKGKTGRKRDLQNLQEGILDGLQGLAYIDDNQVTMLHMTREL
jgi:Holliday junction resolvase RusA-like endonuclease